VKIVTSHSRQYLLVVDN